MNKKIMLFALAAVSAAVLVVPATASALIPLHIEPMAAGTVVPITQPAGAPAPFLTTLNTESGATSTVTCNKVEGSATFEAGGTTGTMELTFSGECRSGPVECRSTNPSTANGTIKTTKLPFHLVTTPDTKPAVLVTPGEGGVFAHLQCSIFVNFKVTGNGVIGTIENPACEGLSTTADLSFEQTSHGLQKHTKVKGTETVYSLKKGAEHAAQVATARLTFPGVARKLVCT